MRAGIGSQFSRLDNFGMSPGSIFRNQATLIFPVIVDDCIMLFGSKKVIAAAPRVTSPRPETCSAETQLRPKKILIVDDDPIIAKTLSLALASKGCTVLRAADGSEAIGLVRDEKPDLLLVDVCLPVDVASGGIVPWDGFQLVRWLKHLTAGAIPAVLISGTNKPEYKYLAAAVGAVGFMPKPIDTAQLLSYVVAGLAGSPAAPSEFAALRMAN
jgi:CheY-like chemotaxis protein